MIHEDAAELARERALHSAVAAAKEAVDWLEWAEMTDDEERMVHHLNRATDAITTVLASIRRARVGGSVDGEDGSGG